MAGKVVDKVQETASRLVGSDQSHRTADGSADTGQGTPVKEQATEQVTSRLDMGKEYVVETVNGVAQASGRRGSTFGKKALSRCWRSMPIVVLSRLSTSVGISVSVIQGSLSRTSKDSRDGSRWLLQESRSHSVCSLFDSSGAGVSPRGSQRRRRARRPMETPSTAHHPGQEALDPGRRPAPHRRRPVATLLRRRKP